MSEGDDEHMSLSQRTSDTQYDFIKLPKTDLHVHLEGTLEAEMMFRLADRNHIPLPWKSPEMLNEACKFRDLSGFLAIYYKGCEVLVTEQDFYDLTRAYLERAASDGVVHTEFFFNPQVFRNSTLPLHAIMRGVFSAVHDMQERISCLYMGTVRRTRPVEEALQTLDELAPWYDRIAAFGMGAQKWETLHCDSNRISMPVANGGSGFVCMPARKGLQNMFAKPLNSMLIELTMEMPLFMILF